MKSNLLPIVAITLFACIAIGFSQLHQPSSGQQFTCVSPEDTSACLSKDLTHLPLLEIEVTEMKTTAVKTSELAVTSVVHLSNTKTNSDSQKQMSSGNKLKSDRADYEYEKPTKVIYDRTEVPTQTFSWDAAEQNVVHGEAGTIVVIPKNAFVFEDGSPARGEVHFELKEVVTKADLILSNVPTNAGNNPLETNGSIFVNASVDGKSVSLANNQSLYVELPTQNKLSDMSIWQGKYDDNGDMDWDTLGTLNTDIFTMPFSSLNLSVPSLSAEMYTRMTAPGNENSYLATREFEARMQALEATSKTHQRTDEIAMFYLAHTNNDLATVDAKVLNYLSQLQGLDPFLDQNHPSNTKITGIKATYKDFKNESITKDNLVLTYGVDLRDSDAQSQLMAKGFSSHGAEALISQLERRDAIIKERARKKTVQDSLRTLAAMTDAQHRYRLKAEMARLAQAVAVNKFEVEALGWINCDRFMKISPAQKMMFAVDVHKSSETFVDAYIVFDNYNSIMRAYRDPNGKYMIFPNVPKHEPVTIVAVGVDKDGVYLGTSEAIIGQNESEEVDLSKVTIKDIEKEMLAFNK